MEERFMREAIDLSIENVRSGRGGPFGTVIARDGKTVATGVNEVTLTNDPTAHAEVVAIRKACRELGTFQLNGCDLYTSCEPCPMCLGAIYWARPDRVFFANCRADAAAIGFDDELIYTEIPLLPEQRRIPMRQIMRDEAQAAFAAWSAQNNRIRY